MRDDSPSPFGASCFHESSSDDMIIIVHTENEQELPQAARFETEHSTSGNVPKLTTKAPARSLKFKLQYPHPE